MPNDFWILIIDDEADLRKLLTDYFEINGYFVMTATLMLFLPSHSMSQ
ncbi:hypothetical protein [Paenibacillus phytorum]|nr:hypothetical protein [Paenibacillus phytorum]